MSREANTELLTPQFVEGQFSDADEESPSSRRECYEVEDVSAVNNENLHTYEWDEDSTGHESNVERNEEKHLPININCSEDLDDSDSDDLDDDCVTCFDLGHHSDHAVTKARKTTFQPGIYSSRICLDELMQGKCTGTSVNKVSELPDRYLRRDKSDRSTVDGVLDKRTYLAIVKLINNKIIAKIEGCISTGKEAKVYYCYNENNDKFALKIYRTSILEFRDRDKYVSGDFKFRRGYGKNNPRKMIKVWGEKEITNLRKIYAAGIPTPKTFGLYQHLLLMEFIGYGDIPAPLLKDADITCNKARELYLQLVHDLFTMYRQCKLVHADLSEFNILYHEEKAYIIDVSQSVTTDHPQAFEFLRKDCYNITKFFRKKGVATATIKELFSFLVDPTITKENKEEYLHRLQQVAASRDAKRDSKMEEEEHEDDIFMKVYLPKSINQVVDFERDFMQLRMGVRDAGELNYQPVLGLCSDLSGAATIPSLLTENSCRTSRVKLENENISWMNNETLLACGVRKEGKEKDQDDTDDKEVVDAVLEKGRAKRNKDETAEQRRERKQLVKSERKEKLKTKVPKHVKKRAMKRGK